MKCEFIFIGKTSEKYLKEGVDQYMKRLVHYLPVSEIILPASSANDPEKASEEEGEVILSKIKPRDLVILLDETGTQLSSIELAKKIQSWMPGGYSKIIFITGGAYGLSHVLKTRANFILSASKFTFTHQMIRLILTEQVYRAMTILRNESYHHG